MQFAGTATRGLMVMLVVLIALRHKLVMSSSLTNMALMKPAAQSSERLSAARAVDGRRWTNSIRGNSCQHTSVYQKNSTHWWIVDLQGYYDIYSVWITNRGDCCGYRLRDFDLEVFMVNPMKMRSAKRHLCYHHNGRIAQGATKLFPCSHPITGRYVRLSINNSEPLHVCEVEVMARPPDHVPRTRMFNRTPGNRAEVDALQEMTSCSVTECLEWCSSDDMCSAVNMGPKISAGRGTVCQLLSFGGIGQPDSTTPDPDWDFYSIGDM